MINIGLIGLDSSHVVSFAQLLSDEAGVHTVPGARIVAAYPGSSPNLAISSNRVDRFTKVITGQYGVRLLDSPEAVAECCDALMITAVDARKRIAHFQRIAPYGKPVFIDKPLALSESEAMELFALSARYSAPVMSSSPRRYDLNLAEALNQCRGDIIRVSARGPLNLIPELKGLFWYGIHAVEAVYTVFGSGCMQLRCRTEETGKRYFAAWRNGWEAEIFLNETGSKEADMTLFTTNGQIRINFTSIDYPIHYGLVSQIVEFFKSGKSPVDQNETLEIIRFIEAANRCGGKEGIAVQFG